MKRPLDDAGSDVCLIRLAESQNMLFLAAHQEAHDKGDTMTAIHAQPKSAPRFSYDQATVNTTAEEATPANLATMLGCMYALIVANLVQVFAGFAAADPSPPAAVVPGIAATALLGLGALPMIRSGQTAGYKLGIAFCLASMVGMGPHKLFLENGGVIAPMALVGFAFELVFIVHAVRALRTPS